MHPLSDKDLDRMSREAAEQYDVEQSTSGWDKLEQKLSKHLPESGKKERRRYLFLIWLFALLSGGGLLWMLTNSTPQQITLKQRSSGPLTPGVESHLKDQPKPGKQSNPTGDEKALSDRRPEQSNPESADATQPGKAGAPTEPEGGLRNQDAQSVPADLSLTTPKPTSHSSKKSTKGRRVERQPLADVIVNSRNKNKVVQPAATALTSISQSKKPVDGIEGNAVESKEVSAKTPNAQPKESTEGISQQPPQISKDTIVQAKEIANESSKTSNAKKSGAKTGFTKGLTLGIVGAPDMSNVKFTNTDKVGFNAGLQIGYRFSSRWSVNTGVLFTRKNYTARGKDFTAPKGTWLDNVTLDEVEGYCNMFDIPINVRYDVTTGNKHRYFVSTGVSSYLMKNEDYHYYYQYTNGSPGYRHRTIDSDERHLFSILNLSAGFEKKIGKRMSLQAEPYFKLPLTGLGYGNLKLNSYGVYFSLRYNTGLFGKK